MLLVAGYCHFWIIWAQCWRFHFYSWSNHVLNIVFVFSHIGSHQWYVGMCRQCKKKIIKTKKKVIFTNLVHNYFRGKNMMKVITKGIIVGGFIYSLVLKASQYQKLGNHAHCAFIFTFFSVCHFLIIFSWQYFKILWDCFQTITFYGIDLVYIYNFWYNFLSRRTKCHPYWHFQLGPSYYLCWRNVSWELKPLIQWENI